MSIEAYKPMIYPVLGQHHWPNTGGPHIEPPYFDIKKGRKQEKRGEEKERKV